jgi:hypothetical protein
VPPPALCSRLEWDWRAGTFSYAKVHVEEEDVLVLDRHARTCTSSRSGSAPARRTCTDDRIPSPPLRERTWWARTNLPSQKSVKDGGKDGQWRQRDRKKPIGRDRVQANEQPRPLRPAIWILSARCLLSKAQAQPKVRLSPDRLKSSQDCLGALLFWDCQIVQCKIRSDVPCRPIPVTDSLGSDVTTHTTRHHQNDRSRFMQGQDSCTRQTAQPADSIRT